MVLEARVVPAGWKLDERELVGCVSVHLVRRQVNEDCVRSQLADQLEKIECAACIDVEVVEGTARCQVVAWLCRAVDNKVERTLVFQNAPQGGPVTDVGLEGAEVTRAGQQLAPVPVGVAIGAEKLGAHVVVCADDLPVAGVEMPHELGANETT